MIRRDELMDQIGDYAREVVQEVGIATTPEWLRLELGMAQLKGLFVLAAASAPMTVGALAQALHIQLPGASHVADRLVQLGLAERNEDSEDRRRTLVRLAERGKALVTQLREGRRDLMNAWMMTLADDDLEALHRGLGALACAVKNARPFVGNEDQQ